MRLALPGSKHAVGLELFTAYEPLARFAKELRSLVRGEREKVVLRGER